VLINESLKIATKGLNTVGANGVIGTAANTVDEGSAFSIDASVAGLLMTIPAPTDAEHSNLVTYSVIGANAISINGVLIQPQNYAIFKWSNSQWQVLANPSTTLSGNIISILEKGLTLAPITFDNLKMRWNAALDRIEVGTVAGTATIDFTERINFGTQGATINGGAGVTGNVQGTPLALSTVYVQIGDGGITGIENRTFNIWTTTGNLHYRVNVLRKGTTTTDGWCTFVVEKIGVTTQTILTAGNGLAINTNVISNPNRVARTTPIATAIAGTTLILGEFEFRYNLNGVGAGTLELRSSTNVTVPFYHYGEEYFPAIGNTRNMVHQAAIVANINTGAFQAIAAGGLQTREVLLFTIVTANNIYTVNLYNYNDTNIHIVAEKAI
jgi:hypothetical protein